MKIKEIMETATDRLVVTMDNGKTFDITDFKGANDMEKMNSFSDSVKKVYSKNKTPVPNYKIQRGANQIGTSTGFGNPYYKESASSTATASGNIAAVANPVQAYAKIPLDKNGIPKAPQKKKKDGTAMNALDVKSNIMGTPLVKR